MMLYAFIKDEASGNVMRVGADCDIPAQLQEKFGMYASYVPAEAAEWDQQVIGGAAKSASDDEAAEAPSAEEAEAPASTEAVS